MPTETPVHDDAASRRHRRWYFRLGVYLGLVEDCDVCYPWPTPREGQD